MTSRYQHAEAFCHMTYVAKDGGSGAEWMMVWNSRDGVTPFGIRHPRTGTDLIHVNWQQDVCDPTHVPSVGSYIFVDLDPERALQIAYEKVERYWDDPAYPMSGQWETKEDAAKVLFEDIYYLTTPEGERKPMGSPDLVQVTEPLHDQFVTRRLSMLGSGLHAR